VSALNLNVVHPPKFPPDAQANDFLWCCFHRFLKCGEKKWLSLRPADIQPPTRSFRADPDTLIPWRNSHVSSMLLVRTVTIAHWQICLQQRVIDGAKAVEAAKEDFHHGCRGCHLETKRSMPSMRMGSWQMAGALDGPRPKLLVMWLFADSIPGSSLAFLDTPWNGKQNGRMTKAILNFALLLLLAVWVAGPAFADVDPWDSYPDTGDTITLFLAVAGICLGAICCLALKVYQLFKPIVAAFVLLPPRLLCEICPVSPRHCFSLGPPQPLRI
jgi:hypothetical protein